MPPAPSGSTMWYEPTRVPMLSRKRGQDIVSAHVPDRRRAPPFRDVSARDRGEPRRVLRASGARRRAVERGCECRRRARSAGGGELVGGCCWWPLRGGDEHPRWRVAPLTLALRAGPSPRKRGEGGAGGTGGGGA